MVDAAHPVTFTVAEGRSLEVLAALLGSTRDDAVMVPVKLDVPRRELVEAGRRRISRAVVRYLTAEEGYKERTVLRGARRVTGRVWDASLGRDFTLRYTRASRTLWFASALHLPTLAALDVSNEATRKVGRVLRDIVDTDATASGDWVFYAIAHGALRGFRLAPGDEEALRRRLRLGSPLAMALNPDANASRDELRVLFARLVNGDNARVAECVEARLARAWSASAASAWSSRQSPDDLTRRWSALGCTLHAWLDAVDGARRMDLARPLLRAIEALVTGPLREGGESVRAALANTSGLRNIGERDALLAAAASVADVGSRLLRRREELASERYGDERYEEAQVYLGDADRLLTPSRRQIEGVARALSGTIG